MQKTLSYLLTGNVGDLLTLFVAAPVGWPLPLPLQLLWMNLVTDGLPALTLVMDPAGAEVLERRRERLVGRCWGGGSGSASLVAAVTLGAFSLARATDTLAHARTVAFTSLVFAQRFNAFGARSFTCTFIEVGSFTNLRLVGVVVVTAVLQLGLLAWPVTQRLFGVGPFSWKALGLSAAAGLVPLAVVEVGKLLRRLWHRRAAAGLPATH